jgi:hypothetical protein
VGEGLTLGVSLLEADVAGAAAGASPPEEQPPSTKATATAAAGTRVVVLRAVRTGGPSLHGPIPSTGPCDERKPGPDQCPVRPSGGVSSKSAVAGSGV